MLDGLRIVLVEDDDIMGGSLLQRLELEGAQVIWFKQMHRALGAIRTPQRAIDLVICDIALPDGDGGTLFETLARTGAPPPFLFITGQGDIGQAVRLMKSGAADYVTKPFDMLVFLERLSLLVSPRSEQDFPPLLGVSPEARRIEAAIARTAQETTPVLIRGGPGTGKDLVARRIHEVSDRRAGAFVAVNLAREQEAGAALFGAGRGLNAVGDSTLFINAVSRMPRDVQDRLLRFLEAGFEGRLITACGNDLEGLIAEGQFSADLFYHLARTEIPVPPLSARPDDAVWLLRHLFGQLAPRHGAGIDGLSKLCEEAARGHDWPGGGRELRARLLRALSVAGGPLLQPADLFPELVSTPDAQMSLAEARDAAEKAQIIAALDRTNGQIGAAAKRLRIARTTLWEKMQKFGLS